jgi:hypothetical protein
MGFFGDLKSRWGLFGTSFPILIYKRCLHLLLLAFLLKFAVFFWWRKRFLWKAWRFLLFLEKGSLVTHSASPEDLPGMRLVGLLPQD